MKKSKNKKKLKEWNGDFDGNPSFRGTGNFGTGNKKQLAAPKDIEDNFLKKPSAEEEMQQSPLYERDGSDMFYRDLPGYPDNATLVHKQVFMPRDPLEDDFNFNDDEKLGPTLYGMPIDKKNERGIDVDTWKSTKPEVRGRLNVYMDSLVDQQKFIQDDDGQIKQFEEGVIGTPSINPGGGSTTWSSGQDALVEPYDYIQDAEKVREKGDINAYNPVGSLGVLVNPTRHVPDDGLPKTVQFKNEEKKMNPIKQFINEVVKTVIEEMLDEAAPQEMKQFIPGLALAGNQVPKDILDQINNFGIQIINPSKTLPTQFEQGITQIKDQLKKYQVPDNVINTIATNMQASYKENISLAQKAMLSQAQKQKQQIQLPPQMQKQKAMPEPDEIAGIKLYYTNINQSSNAMDRRINNEKLNDGLKELGEEKLSNYIASLEFSSVINPFDRGLNQFLKQKYHEIFGKTYNPKASTQQNE